MGDFLYSITRTIPATSGESNAGPQPRLKAGARDERRLAGVGCRPLLGCWGPTRAPGLPGDRPPPLSWAPPGPLDATKPGRPWKMAADTAPGGTGYNDGERLTPPCPARRPGSALPPWWAWRCGRSRPPPPDPAARPHAGQQTLRMPWRRTRRHPTPPLLGLGPPPRPRTQAGAHVAPTNAHGPTGWHGWRHHRCLGPRRPSGVGRAGAAMPTRPRCVEHGGGVPGLLLLWATPGNTAAQQQPNARGEPPRPGRPPPAAELPLARSAPVRCSGPPRLGRPPAGHARRAPAPCRPPTVPRPLPSHRGPHRLGALGDG